MKRTTLTLAALLAIILTGCGHTNNLGKYDLSRQDIYFEEIVTPEASEVRIVYPETEEHEETAFNVVEAVATVAGALILESHTESKLHNAANPEDVAKSISLGIEKGLAKYLWAKPVRTLYDDTRYIVTTKLTDCAISSSPLGVYLTVEAVAEITDRLSGETVWENRESKEMPMQWSPGFYGLLENNTLGKIAQAAELASVSEEQIAEAVRKAAESVGQDMSETLREDVREARAD
jgi:hypothetical protein